MYILRIQEFLYIEFHILVKLENFWENLFSRSLLMQNPFLPAVQISFDLRIGKEKIPDKGPALEQLIPYLQYHWQSGPCIINFAWIPEENQYERSSCSRTYYFLSTDRRNSKERVSFTRLFTSVINIRLKILLNLQTLYEFLTNLTLPDRPINQN